MHIINFIKTKYPFKFVDNNLLLQNKDCGIFKVSTKKKIKFN